MIIMIENVLRRVAYKYKTKPSVRIVRELRRFIRTLIKDDGGAKKTGKTIESKAKLLEKNLTKEKVEELYQLVKREHEVGMEMLDLFYKGVEDVEVLLSRELKDIERVRKAVNRLADKHQITREFAQRLYDVVVEMKGQVSGELDGIKNTAAAMDRDQRGGVMSIRGDRAVYRGTRRDTRGLKRDVKEQETLVEGIDAIEKSNKVENLESLIKGLKELFAQETKTLIEIEENLRLEMFRFNQFIKNVMESMDHLINVVKKKNATQMESKLEDCKQMIGELIAKEKTVMHNLKLQAKSESREAA